MVLQYVAASFHLLSVGTCNIKTVQQPNHTSSFVMQTIPAVVMPKVLLPQSNIMAAFVHNHSNLFSYACSGLPSYNNHIVTKLTVYSVPSFATNLLILLPTVYNCQHTAVNLISQCLTARW